MTPRSRGDCLALDAADPLAPLRELFDLPGAEGSRPAPIYLDGNSLGALPRGTADRVARAVQDEWGRGLIGSWNDAGWIDLPQRVGDKIATLIGAAPGEVVVADSTSVNLFKLLSLALDLARAQETHSANGAPPKAPARRIVLSERSNFPTDLYIADSLARERGFELRLVDGGADGNDAVGALAAQLDERVAVLMLTQVHYRSGRLHDMAALSAAAHAVGALTVWDLAHSAGALPIDLHAAQADFAVGCGYKYLNGGPGAPAFAWAHPRHWATAERLSIAQPLAGWMGHAAPFTFTPQYRPAPGARQLLCGTPPVLSLTALECGVDTLLAAAPLGGLAALRAKSIALCELFIEQVQARCARHMGLELASPREAALRGSQVSFALPDIGYAVMQALIARGVVGDFRAGSTGAASGDPADRDILRFGFTPLYTRHVDVYDAAQHLAEVLDHGAWRDPQHHRRQAVT